MAKATRNSIKDTGAKAGSIVYGTRNINQGVRIKLLESQPPNQSKGANISGRFIILAAGSGCYRKAFELFHNKETDAKTLLARGRTLGKEFEKMTYPIFNSNLILEES